MRYSLSNTNPADHLDRAERDVLEFVMHAGVRLWLQGYFRFGPGPERVCEVVL